MFSWHTLLLLTNNQLQLTSFRSAIQALCSPAVRVLYNIPIANIWGRSAVAYGLTCSQACFTGG